MSAPHIPAPHPLAGSEWLFDMPDRAENVEYSVVK
jgi:hypothetical protein